MTTDEQYVPSDEDMRWHYAVKRMEDGATRTHAEREYTRWLAVHDARVRRDAAREALDGLARESMCAFKSPLAPPDPRSWAEMTGAVEWYRDTHYPEETP